MTRSSSTKLIEPLDNPEQLFRSSKKLTIALSVNHLNLSEFNTFLEEKFEEEGTTETMTKPTIEEYMTITQEDCGSGIIRPKFDDKANFELKGQILKELRTKTFSGADDEDPNEKEVCVGPQYTKDCKDDDKTLEEAYYTQFGVPFPGGRYRTTTPRFYRRDDGNNSYQERKKTLEESLKSFMAESSKRHAENNNLIKEFCSSTDAALRNQRASIKALEIQIRQLSKILHDQVSSGLPSSTEANPRDRQVHFNIYQKDLNDVGGFEAYFAQSKLLNDSLPQKEKDPGSFSITCFINNKCFSNALAALGASKRETSKGIVENVLVRIKKFVFLIDFIVLDMPEDIKTPLILG
ncbi:hypothetical protein Tco_1173536 [Tanacetum coccineum]